MRGTYEIGQASVLGFIPTQYPAGIVLLEVWRNDTMENVTGMVSDIDNDSEWYWGHYFSGRDRMEKARADFIKRAMEAGN